MLAWSEKKKSLLIYVVSGNYFFGSDGLFSKNVPTNLWIERRRMVNDVNQTVMTKDKRLTTGAQKGDIQKMNDGSKISILEGRRRALQRVKAHIRKEQKRPGFRRKARSKSALHIEKVVNHPKPWDDTACTRNAKDVSRRRYAKPTHSNNSTYTTLKCNNQSKIKYHKEPDEIHCSNKGNTDTWFITSRENPQNVLKPSSDRKNNQTETSRDGSNNAHSRRPM